MGSTYGDDDIEEVILEFKGKLAIEMEAMLAEHHQRLKVDFDDWRSRYETMLEVLANKQVDYGTLDLKTAQNHVLRLTSIGPRHTRSTARHHFNSRKEGSRHQSVSSHLTELSVDSGARRMSHVSTYAAFSDKKKRIALKKTVEARSISNVASNVSTCASRLKESVAALLNMPAWDYFIAVVIIVSALLIGVDVGSRDPRTQVVANKVQMACNVAFIIELAMRIFVQGRSFFRGPSRSWNAFDSCVVLISIGDMMLETMDIGSDTAIDNLQVVRVARIFRMIRIIRVMRLFNFVRPLRLLTQSILSTFKSLIYACLMLLIIMYTFGVFFVHAAGPAPPGHGEDTPLHRYFGSLGLSVLTLLQAITNGISWGLVYQALHGEHWVYGAAFVFYIIFSMFAVMNVMTGIFCQAAIETARSDEQEVIAEQISNRQEYVKSLKALFSSLAGDRKGEGTLTLQTFEEHMCDEKVEAYFHALDMKVFDAWTLFKLLDEEDDNQIDMDKFVEGCIKLRGPATTIDIRTIQSEIRWLTRHIDNKLAGLLAAAAAAREEEDEDEWYEYPSDSEAERNWGI